MNDREINIAIAEACGLLGPWTEQVTSCGCDGQWDLFNSDKVRLPDCCNDLNAMHEAEKILKDNKNQRVWDSYILFLDESLGSGDKIHATASQRAEAFLRTIGKWKEDTK